MYYRGRVLSSVSLISFLLAIAAMVLSGCGGGSSPSTGGGSSQAPAPQPDFSISAPASVTVTPNLTQTITISVTPENGFSNPVDMSVSGLPPGVTAAPATFTLTPGSSAAQHVGAPASALTSASAPSQVVVITANASVTPGLIGLTVTGTSGSISHVDTTSTSQADFAFSVPSSAVALTAGGTAQITVSADAFDGFSGPVSATLSGLPSGVTASSSTLTLTPGTPQTVTLSAASSVQSSSATLTLQGTSGTLSHNLELSLTLAAAAPPPPPPPDFSLSLTPNALTLAPGGSAGQVAISATAINGLTGSIAVTLSGLPSGVVAMPASFILTPGTPQQISFTAASTDAAGAATVTFNAAAGAITHSAALALTITAPPPDFSLQVSPATLSLNPGSGAQAVTISAAALNGFSGQVSVALSGLPANVSVSPATLALAPGIAQTVNVTAGSNAAAGTGSLNLTASSGTITHTASLGLTITAPTPDFIFSASPAQVTLVPGGTYQPVVLSMVPVNGFNSAVQIAAGNLPTGIAVSPDLSSYDSGGNTVNFVATTAIDPIAPNVPEVVYVQAASDVTSPVTIDFQGTSGQLSHSASVAADLANGSDFNLGAATTGLLLYPGISAPPVSSSFIANETIYLESGQINPPVVSLVSQLPPGITATSVPGAGIFGLNFTVTSQAVGTSGILAFQASNGPLTREVDVPYTVVSGGEFTQLLTPATLTLPQGSTEDLFAALASTSQFPLTFTAPTPSITLTGLPQGVTNLSSPSSLVSLPGLISEQLSAAPTTPVGQSLVTMTTGWNGLTQTSQFLLNVVSIPNFTLAAVPTSLAIPAGQSQPLSLSATAINGFTGDVAVNLTPPVGVTVSPSSFTLTPGAPPQVITVTLGTTPPVGSISVQATSGDLSQTLQIPVYISQSASVPDFSITGILPLTLGASGLPSFEVMALNGFSGVVTLTISGFPPGILLGWTPSQGVQIPLNSTGSVGATVNCQNPVGGGFCVGAYIEAAYDGAAAGTYPLTLTATSGSITHTYQMSLTVTPPDYSLSVSPVTLLIPPGNTQSLNINATPTIAWPGFINFAIAGLPSGVTASQLTFKGLAAGQATISMPIVNFTVAANAAPGTYPLTITAQNQIEDTFGYLIPWPGFTHTVQVPLVIGPSTADFTLSYAPANIVFSQGEAGLAFTVTATGMNGFYGPVAFSELSGLPAGVTEINGPATTVPGQPGQYSLNASSTAALGPATLTFQATSGTLFHTLSVPITITPAPDFSLSVPANTNLAPGSTQQVAIGATPLNGFASAVNVTLSGLSSSVTASPSTFTLTPGTPQQVTLTAAAAAAVEPLALTVTATAASDSLSHTQVATVDVGGTGEQNFALSNSPNPLSVPIGGQVVFQLQQIPVNGFNENVQLALNIPLCSDPAASTAAICLAQVIGSSIITGNPVTLAQGQGYFFTLTGNCQSTGSAIVTLTGTALLPSGQPDTTVPTQNVPLAVNFVPNPATPNPCS